MKEKLLVVAVHPDDETLGCGGTILKHKAAGHEVHWLIITQPGDHATDEFRASRKEEISKVTDLYKFDSVTQLEFESCGLNDTNLNSLIGECKKTLGQLQPDTIFLPFLFDAHSDHRVTFSAFQACLKKFRAPFIKKVFMMEVLSETDFSPGLQGTTFAPNTYIDISDYMEQKLRAMQIYSSEIEDHPFPRSPKNIESLAITRGAEANCNFAESFMLLKQYL